MPRGVAFVREYLRHRIQTAPILAASILIHCLILSSLAVLVVQRAGTTRPYAGLEGIDPDLGGAASTDLPGSDTSDLLPRDNPRPPLPKIPDEEPKLVEDKPEPLRDFVPSKQRAPSEIAGWLASRREPETQLRRSGAAESIPAIKKGLRWLAKQQLPDGSWPSGSDSTYRVGVTGLSLLAFLAEGYSEGHGTYQAVVRRGIGFLRNRQSKTGLFGPDQGNYLYNHILALQALAENNALEQKKDDIAVGRGLELLLRAQQTNGGWGYEVRPDSGKADSSITGWVVFLLSILEKMELQVPTSTREKAHAWFRSVTDAEGRVGYRRRGDSADDRFTLTCVGLLSDQLLTNKLDPTQVAYSLATALENVTQGKTKNYSLWYHTTIALRGSPSAFARWEPTVRKALITSQHKTGSWSPTGVYGDHAGRAYTTAINLLTLQVHYRYR